MVNFIFQLVEVQFVVNPGPKTVTYDAYGLWTRLFLETKPRFWNDDKNGGLTSIVMPFFRPNTSPPSGDCICRCLCCVG